MGDAGGEECNGIESLKNFERALGHVRNSARPLSLMSREEVGACISPSDRAKLNLQMAYGITSLFYMFLKTQGVSPNRHPVKAELDRIRGYFGRLKAAGKPPEQRTLKVDTAASRRFIDSALSGDKVWKEAQARNRASSSSSATKKTQDAGIGRSGPEGAPENPGAAAATSAANDKFVFVGIPLGKRKNRGGLLTESVASKSNAGKGGGGSGGDSQKNNKKPQGKKAKRYHDKKNDGK